MIKKKRRLSHFPNTFLLINKKTYRTMNTKFRNINKDFNFFLSMDKGKITDKLRMNNKNIIQDFFRLNANEKIDQKKKFIKK